jgi:hypothetical protein
MSIRGTTVCHPVSPSVGLLLQHGLGARALRGFAGSAPGLMAAPRDFTLCSPDVNSHTEVFAWGVA